MSKDDYKHTGGKSQAATSKNGTSEVSTTLSNDLQRSLLEIPKSHAVLDARNKFERVVERLESGDFKVNGRVPDERLHDSIVLAHKKGIQWAYLDELLTDQLHETRDDLFNVFCTLVATDEHLVSLSDSEIIQTFENRYVTKLNDMNEENQDEFHATYGYRWSQKIETKSVAPIMSDGAGNGLIYENELNMLFGASGVGKSTLATQIAVACASGRPFLGKYSSIKMSAGVVIISCEDTPYSIENRVDRAAKNSNVKESELLDKIFIHSPVVYGARFSIIDGATGDISERWFSLLEYMARKHRGALIILDHLLGFGGDYIYQRNIDKANTIERALRLLLKTNTVLTITHSKSNSTSSKVPLDLSIISGEVSIANSMSSVLLARKDIFEEEGRLFHLKNRHGAPTTSGVGVKYEL